MPAVLSPQEYRARVNLVEEAQTLVAKAKPSELLAMLDHAETVAPITDPTLFQQSRDAAASMRRLLEAARPLEDV